MKSGLDREHILPKGFDYRGIYKPTFKKWGEIPLAAALDCVATSKDVAALMDASDRAVIDTAYIKNWLKKIRTLPTYGKFSEHIEALGDILSSSDKALDGLDTNIKKTWKD